MYKKFSSRGKAIFSVVPAKSEGSTEHWALLHRPGCGCCPLVSSPYLGGSSVPSLYQKCLDWYPAAASMSWKSAAWNTRVYSYFVPKSVKNNQKSRLMLHCLHYSAIWVWQNTGAVWHNASSEFFQSTLWCISALTFISSKFLPCVVISWITEVKC